MARALISKKIQVDLCLSTKNKLQCSWRNLAAYLNVHPHTLYNWYRAERLLPEVFLRLLEITNAPIINFKLLSNNWGQIKGGQNVKLRHTPLISFEARQRALAKIIRANKARTKIYPLPELSSSLAEFMGIMLGDGGITRDQFL